MVLFGYFVINLQSVAVEISSTHSELSLSSQLEVMNYECYKRQSAGHWNEIFGVMTLVWLVLAAGIPLNHEWASLLEFNLWFC